MLELHFLDKLRLTLFHNFRILFGDQVPEACDECRVVLGGHAGNLKEVACPTQRGNLVAHACQGGPQRTPTRHNTDALLQIEGANALEVPPDRDPFIGRFGGDTVDQQQPTDSSGGVFGRLGHSSLVH